MEGSVTNVHSNSQTSTGIRGNSHVSGNSESILALTGQSGQDMSHIGDHQPSLRIKFFVTKISNELRLRIAKKIPDFDGEHYSSMLTNTLSDLR